MAPATNYNKSSQVLESVFFIKHSRAWADDKKGKLICDDLIKNK
jgi:hypothetical protein